MADQPNTATRTRRNARLLADLLDRSEYKLRRQATRHSERADDVDDVLQSAYALFLERFRGDCEPLAWLYTTVKREAWAMRRRASRQRERSATVVIETGGEVDLVDAVPIDVPGPAERYERAERFREELIALSSLKPDERCALGLFALGLSYAEICERTGWTHTKVNRCLSEGRASLRSKS